MINNNNNNNSSHRRTGFSDSTGLSRRNLAGSGSSINNNINNNNNNNNNINNINNNNYNSNNNNFVANEFGGGGGGGNDGNVSNMNLPSQGGGGDLSNIRMSSSTNSNVSFSRGTNGGGSQYPETRGESKNTSDFYMMRASQKASSYFPISEEETLGHHGDELAAQIMEGPGMTEKTGMYVYAKNLTYTVKNESNHKERLDLLHDMSFYLKPREMTLILGSPGCGKSSLFKVLAGQVKDAKLEGSLLFNGHPINHKNHHRDVAFVTQEDYHMPLLTVKETLAFALDCQAPSSLTKQQKKDKVDLCMKSLGLYESRNTLVGDELVRGISGGQKKRVTIGVNVIGGSNLILMDEPTTGLDSSTSLDIIGRLRRIVTESSSPALITLLQPSAQLTSLFDNLMILSLGQIIYFGPLADALDYFEKLGFVCPKHNNPSEFFQEIVDDPERYSYLHPPKCQTSDDFVKAYRESTVYQDLMRSLEEHPNGIMGDQAPEAMIDSSDQPKFSHSMPRQVVYTVVRGFRMIARDYAGAAVRVTKGVVMGLILGGLFFQLDHDQKGGNDRFGLLFFAMTFIIFSSFGSIQQFFAQRQIFYVQRSQKFYGTTPYFIANTICDMPAFHFVLDVWIKSYTGSVWLFPIHVDSVRYRNTSSSFKSFILLIYLLIIKHFRVDQMSNGFVKMVSSLSPTIGLANIISSAVLGILLLMSGFMAPRNITGGWWIWLYFISPYTWAFEGLAINEFSNQAYYCRDVELVPPQSDPLLNVPVEFGGYGGSQVCPMTQGEDFLRQFGMHTNDGFKYLCIVFILFYTLFFFNVAFLALTFLRFYPKHKTKAIDNNKNSFLNIFSRGTSTGKQKVYSQSQSESVITRAASSSGSAFTDVGSSGPTIANASLYSEAKVQRQNEEEAVHQRLKKRKKKVKDEHIIPEDRSNLITDGSYLEFKDLCYSVDYKQADPDNPKIKKKIKLQLLDNVSGFCKPGTMLALMGPSGAGKSTLLDVIAGRKTGGYITGDILVNGKPKNKFFNRIAAYVEQQDVLPPTQTVREAIHFSAECRLDKSVSKEQKLETVDKIIELLNLKKIENMPIGVLGDGISLSQRKRVNIGVELASGPQILFLDEPTSGLDSGAAYKVINPSSTIFEKFDSLLLLQKGGKTIYFGPLGHHSEDVLRYISQFNMEIKPHYNPADFVLEIADGTRQPLDEHGNKLPFDGPGEYRKSDIYLITKDQSAQGIVPKDFTAPQYDHQYAASWSHQFGVLQKRAAQSRVRRPINIIANLFRSLLLATVLGTLFVRMKHEQRDARARVSLIFFSLLFGGMAAISTIPTTCLERSVFYRERASGFYTVSSYMLSYIISGYPLLFFTVVFYVVPVFFISGLDSGDHSGWWFMHYMDIIRYPFEAIAVNEFDGSTFYCTNNKGAIPIPLIDGSVKYYCPITDGIQWIQSYGFHWWMRYIDIPITIGFYLIFMIGAALSLKFIKWQVK
ncbi:ABC transporter G family protein [Heterostelium album PN500]|uniref:ABC transporter G family protein n=1 Tax=Heterostelium pallidum (strain ATCC 26659 / Pp 5 / PN500) TaxID=670386 RepID=D3AY21_HETP5|nr:ABC transporter G family protein [Heterostelium album PN500]EFA85848.1 ABC transporter G family protein [Heterostelium album PN500]|eukprot:XP_020437954.1 ABC transporter G family protein [Heterostelium album PN500]